MERRRFWGEMVESSGGGSVRGRFTEDVVIGRVFHVM